MKSYISRIAGIMEQLPILKTFRRNAINAFFFIESKKRGMRVINNNISISIRKNKKEIILSNMHHIYVYDMIKYFDYYHGAVVSKNELYSTVDYSKTRMHQLSKSGVEFEFPSLPESDESTETYLNALKLRDGDVVLDLGAYAGASAYFMSKSVGDAGLIVSFEPDETNFKSLAANIKKHNLKNVTIVRKGIWSSTKTIDFQSEGNMGSSASDISSRKSNVISIDVLSLNDAAEFANKRKIDAIKMDIEGAELEVLKNAEAFLKKHNLPRLVIEPHVIEGTMNTEEICKVLKSYGYSIELLCQGVQNWPLIAAEPNQ
jgi:FkbM family methyltransferase